MKSSLLFLLALLLVSQHDTSAQTITTLVGGGVGDGGAATNGNLAAYGLTFDAAGSLYIADTSNHRIRKLDGNGIITTVAGNGTAGFSGDGGTATNAALNSPRAVIFDAAGNLYIADASNFRVRKVGTNGIITTVAGNGDFYYLSGDGGPATNSAVHPFAFALDGAGALYVADWANHRIRRVGTDGIITTVAGRSVNGNASVNGTTGDGGAATNAYLNHPSGIAFDVAGNLYVADSYYQLIRKVDTNGIISSVAGSLTAPYSSVGGYPGAYGGDGGGATGARLNFPTGVSFDAAGNLYIADSLNNRIRKMATNGIITTVAGKGTNGFSGDGSLASLAYLSTPVAVITDAAGYLYIADFNNGRVRKVANNLITTVAGGGVGDGATGRNAALNGPVGVGLGVSGNLYIADQANHRIRKFGTNGIITTVAGKGTNGFSGDGGAATSASLNSPSGVVADATGILYIADTANHRIRKVALNGNISTVAGNGTASFSGDSGQATSATLSSPAGVALDLAGNLYIADQGNHRIRRVSTGGVITTVAGNGAASYSGDGTTNASLNNPKGVALDLAGNVYIADYFNHRVRKVDTNGVVTTVAGNGTAGSAGDGNAATNANLYTPSSVAVDAAGNLFIADYDGLRVRQVGSNGLITTVAGNGVGGYAGDGGTATSANIRSVTGLCVDAAGNLYFPQNTDNVVRKVSGFMPPQNFRISAGANSQQVVVQFEGTANYPYVLQTAISLTMPVNWESVVTNPCDAGGHWQLTVTNPGAAPKFYRALGQ